MFLSVCILVPIGHKYANLHISQISIMDGDMKGLELKAFK